MGIDSSSEYHSSNRTTEHDINVENVDSDATDSNNRSVLAEVVGPDSVTEVAPSYKDILLGNMECSPHNSSE